MLVVTRYSVPPEEWADFRERCRAALDVLTSRPGCTGGRVGCAVDDPALWLLATSWQSVGAYRRALSATDVKQVAVPLMYRALDEPSAFEELLTWTPSGGLVEQSSDLAAGVDAPDDADPTRAGPTATPPTARGGRA